MDLNNIYSILKNFQTYYSQINYNLINDYIHFYNYKAAIEDDEDLLNRLWCIKNIFFIKIEYVKAFSKLKQDKFHEAWCRFANVENRYKILMNFYNHDEDEFNINFIYEYTKKFQKFFPYKTFSSPEFLVKKFKCSICGKTYNIKPKCDHKVGRLYHGRLCSKVCLDMDIISVSLVKNPADKCTVVFPEEGDIYNYALIKSLSCNLSSPV